MEKEKEEDKEEEVEEVKEKASAKDFETILEQVYTPLNAGDFKMAYREVDVDDQWLKFKVKVRGSPKEYGKRDLEGLKQAFNYHLSHAPKKHERNKTPSGAASALVTSANYSTKL
jgi:hypothetical protein